MNRLRQPTALVLAVLTSGLPLGSCATVGETVTVDSMNMPPLASPLSTRNYITPYSQRFRIAVLTFIDQTQGKAEIVTESVADMLTTELYGTGRFDLVDRKDFRNAAISKIVTEQQQKKKKETRSDDSRTREDKDEGAAQTQTLMDLSGRVETQYRAVQGETDGILIGYITSFRIDDNKGEFSADYRIVNPNGQLVVFSEARNVHFTTDAGMKSVNLVRKDVTDMATSISNNFISLAEIQRQTLTVVDIAQDQQGGKITINAGQAAHVKPGFAGFVVERDPRTMVDRYLAAFVIVNVFPTASTGVLTTHAGVTARDQLQSIVIGSEVRLK